MFILQRRGEEVSVLLSDLAPDEVVQARRPRGVVPARPVEREARDDLVPVLVVPPEVEAQVEQRGQALVPEARLLRRELVRLGHRVVVHVHGEAVLVRKLVEAGHVREEFRVDEVPAREKER